MLSKKEEITYFVALAVVVPLIIAGVTPYFMNHRTSSVVPGNGIPVINVKVRVPQPTLIIKVNGETKVRMKDPFTSNASVVMGTILATHLGGKTVDLKMDSATAELYDAPYVDLWKAIPPHAPNITLTTFSSDVVDNGTAIIGNITFTGISPANINISSIDMLLKTKYTNPYQGIYISSSFILIATNLPTTLTLAVNDSIVIQWIITAPYSDTWIKTLMQSFVNGILVPASSIPNGYQYLYLGNSQYGLRYGVTQAYLCNGSATQPASTHNFVWNISIPNHLYLIELWYFDTTVPNPTWLALKTESPAVVIFNETITGLGADRAVLLKFDVSFG